VSRHIIITSCTKNKSTQFIPDGHFVSPSDYLPNPASVEKLSVIRSAVFTRPNSAYHQHATQHYAFDLYVRDQNTQLYRGLRNTGLAVMVRERLLSAGNEIEWYFLSGGYGLLHALEMARPYQATFDRKIAIDNGIPHTLPQWKPTLPLLLDEIFCRTVPSSVSVFGSKTYVDMVRATDLYGNRSDLFDIRSGRPNTLSTPLVDKVLRLFKA
jgi:cytoplasmic iron level regulating protein YaaA (DUF328/UPF0246 family)